MEEFEVKEEQDELYEVEAGIEPEQLELMVEQSGQQLSASGTIGALVRGKSRLFIGDPLVWPLTAYLNAQGRNLSSDLRLQLADYEFYLIQFACSFQPAPATRFVTASFEIELDTGPGQPDAQAYAMFPAKVEDELKISRKFSLDANLNFEFGPVKTQTGPGFSQTKDYLNYQSRLYAFGLQGHELGWNFARTALHEIDGNYKLFLLLRKPKGSTLHARMGLRGEVEVILEFGPLGPFPLSTTLRHKGQPVTHPTVRLC